MPRRIKTNIFQDTQTWRRFDGEEYTEIRYYSIIENKPSRKIGLIAIGSLEISSTGERIWRDSNSLYGIFHVSWFRNKIVAAGEGNLIGGRVIKNRIPPMLNGGGTIGWGENILLECYLPRESISSINQ